MTTMEAERKIHSLTMALEHANETVRRKVEELQLLRRVGDVISRETSVSSLSQELAETLTASIICSCALIYAGSDKRKLELRAVSSIFGSAQPFPASLTEARIASHLEREGEGIHIDDIRRSQEWAADWPLPKRLPSWLCIPLSTTAGMRGVLFLGDGKPMAFDERTLRILSTVAPQIAHAMETIDLVEKYKSLARANFPLEAAAE